MHQLQRSWVRSQHPSAQWNLRGGRWSSAEYSMKKIKKSPPTSALGEFNLPGQECFCLRRVLLLSGAKGSRNPEIVHPCFIRYLHLMFVNICNFLFLPKYFICIKDLGTGFCKHGFCELYAYHFLLVAFCILTRQNSKMTPFAFLAGLMMLSTTEGQLLSGAKVRFFSVLSFGTSDNLTTSPWFFHDSQCSGGVWEPEVQAEVCGDANERDLRHSLRRGRVSNLYWSDLFMLSSYTVKKYIAIFPSTTVQPGCH